MRFKVTVTIELVSDEDTAMQVVRLMRQVNGRLLEGFKDGYVSEGEASGRFTLEDTQ